MQVSYEKMFRFLGVARAWMEKNDEEPGNPKSKLAYAMYRVFEQTDKLTQKYQNRLQDLDIEFCAVDEKGVILKDAQGLLCFKKEDLRRCNDEKRKLMEQTIEVEPYMATQLPKEFTEVELDCFDGFILDRSKIESKAAAAEA